MANLYAVAGPLDLCFIQQDGIEYPKGIACLYKIKLSVRSRGKRNYVEQCGTKHEGRGAAIYLDHCAVVTEIQLAPPLTQFTLSPAPHRCVYKQYHSWFSAFPSTSPSRLLAQNG